MLTTSSLGDFFSFREKEKMSLTEKTDIRDSDEKVVEIEMERLRNFTNHPFKIIGDSQMIELQDRLDVWGNLRIAFTLFPLSKNKKIYVFESDILYILLADSIINTAKRFREMKKLQFLKVGD